MPPFTFDPFNGVFVPAMPALPQVPGGIGGAGTGIPPGHCEYPVPGLGGTFVPDDPSSVTPAQITELSSVLCRPQGATGPGPTGGFGEPTSAGGGPSTSGTCPDCGCVTCQCIKDANTPPPRKCYQLPDGSMVWLTDQDEVPPNATPCAEVTQPTQPGTEGETPQPTPGPAPTENAVIAGDLSCLASFAWGSPDWCKCAELFRGPFTELGRRLLAAWDSTEYDNNGVGASVWGYAIKLVPILQECGFVDLDPQNEFENAAFKQVAVHVIGAYGNQAPVMVGLYFLRAMLDTFESLKANVHGGKEYHCDNQLGVAKLGLGSGWGENATQTMDYGFSLAYSLPLVRHVIDQLIQYFVPVERPGVGTGVSLFTAGLLNLPQFACYLQSHGINPLWAEPIALAERSKPTQFDWIAYWRRGKINDNQLSTALRSLGFTLPDEQQVLVEVSTLIPPPTDLVRFMLRSIGDPNVVARFQLEDEFDILFQGRIKQWTQANGIPENVLRAYHAAHWVVPSPGDLAVFWQRFSTNRDSPQANALPTKMSGDDYNRALREQGIAPFWRPFFLAAQYAVLGRRDLQLMYQFGSIDEQGLKDGFLDAAFSPEKLDGLVRVTKQRAIKQWLADPIVKAYAKNGINESGLKQYMEDIGVPEELRSEVIDRVKIEATEAANEETVKLLEKQYELGGLDNQSLLFALQSLQLDQDQIQRIVLSQQRQKAARPKLLPAIELCRFYGARLLGRAEFLSRLVALNYTPNDAELIILKCESDLTAKQLKQEQITLKAQATAMRRQLKDLAQTDRQAQLAKDRAAKQLAAQIKAQRQAEAALQKEQAKEQAAIERALRKAELSAAQAEREELRVLADMEFIVDHFSKLSGVDSAALMPALQSALTSATADGSVTVQEVLGAARRILAGKPTDLPDQLSDLIALAQLQVTQAGAEVPATVTNGATQGNGLAPT